MKNIDAIREELIALENDPDKMDAIMGDPVCRKDFTEKMKIAWPDQAEEMERLAGTMDALANYDESNPAVQEIKKLAQSQMGQEKQIQNFEKDANTQITQFKKDSASAVTKRRLVGGVAALVAGGATYALMPVASLPITILAVAGGGVSGGLIGSIVGDQIWVKPVLEAFDSHRRAWEKEAEKLDAKSSGINQAVDRSGKNLMNKYVSQGDSSRNPDSNFVEKLAKQGQSSDLIVR